jgi:protein O-GlcNAc transferase
MSSLVSNSIAHATGYGDAMVTHSGEEYVERAVVLARSLSGSSPDEKGKGKAEGMGELLELRRSLFLARDTMPLFDTYRWVRNLEIGLHEAWRRWVEGTEFEGSDEWQAAGQDAKEHKSGCIYVEDEDARLIVGAVL